MSTNDMRSGPARVRPFATAELLALIVSLVGAVWPAPSTAAVYDAAADFSASSNPSGVWRYGWADTIGGPFNMFTAAGNAGSLSIWWSGVPNYVGGYDPVVAHNGTADPVGNADLTWAPGQLSLHPGFYNSGRRERPYAVLRWTAPNSGEFSINAEFVGLDNKNRTRTDVHVLLNDVSLFDGLVDGFGDPFKEVFSAVRSITAGDRIDFVVGPEADYQFDTTALALVISDGQAPEPATLALLGLGLAGLAAARRRR